MRAFLVSFTVPFDDISKDTGLQVLEMEINFTFRGSKIFNFRDITGKIFAIAHTSLPC